MKKILAIFGTRPEAIKLAPVIFALSPMAQVEICVTAQHRRMLDQAMCVFGMNADYDLDIMKNNQSLCDTSARILAAMGGVFEKSRPDIVLVQGDTVTASMAALAAFYHRVPIGHLEAGLRTYDPAAPFPEEINRQLISRIANFHFAPTQSAKENLIREGISSEQVFLTGNTIVDALQMIIPKAREAKWPNSFPPLDTLLSQRDHHSGRLILVTGHRRENFGRPFQNICEALRQIANQVPDVVIIYPVHLNPNIETPVKKSLEGLKNIFLLPPLDYLSFVKLMDLAHIILTDSGGIQEEAPSLSKPVLVMRNKTERPEGVAAGVARLVGTEQETIVSAVLKLLQDPEDYSKMQSLQNPYGDGQAAARVADVVMKVTQG